MKSVRLLTLAEYQGGEAEPIDDIEFPAVGEPDADIFENNLLEVMQFIFNHTTFDPRDEIDQKLLAAYKPLGVVPGQVYDESKVARTDGEPMSAGNDYRIRMSADELPPARTFWSFTLYDTENGWFMPNEWKKYSMGENGGRKLNEEGGIDIYIAAEKPEGVPKENWLPLKRGNYGIDVILRIYVPDLEKFKNWTPPKAEKLLPHLHCSC